MSHLSCDSSSTPQQRTPCVRITRRRVGQILGFFLREDQRPANITPEDWAWLCSSAAYSAASDAAYDLLPAEVETDR